MKTFLFLTLAFGTMIVEAAPKAQDQAMSKTVDVEVTRKIRDRLTNSDGLSTKAQNVTIVTDDWGITLQGEVKKESEITIITNIAEEYAGQRAVRSQLKVVK